MARTTLSVGEKRKRLSQDALRRLAQMGYDPLVELVKTHLLVNEELADTRFDDQGGKKERYDKEHYRSLLDLRLKISKELLPYVVPKIDTIEPEEQNEVIEGNTIILTDEETYPAQLAQINPEQLEDEINMVEQEIIDEDLPLEISEPIDIPITHILKIPELIKTI